MFEIGFQEMLLISFIALIVLGPEKLPKLARTLGHWAGRAKSYVRHLTAELEREVAVQETRDQLQRLKGGIEESTQVPLQPPEPPPQAKPDAGPGKSSE